MNILFFLTPKSEVAYIHDDESLRQVLEKMEYHKYSAVPIISRQGTYVGTITEGDLLWYIKNQLDLNLQEARRILITNVPRRSDNTPVSIDSNMEDLLDKAMKQNFVPVLDDKKSFLITNVPRRSDNTPVSIDSNMEDLLDKAMKQNFVPVLDDKRSFIGIVTRKDIMKYFADKMKKAE